MAPRTCSTKHNEYVHIVLTWRSWWLYLHSCRCEVIAVQRRPCVRVCLCRPLVGAVSVVESPVLFREGAGSIPTAYMAPLPKRRGRRRSCCERLTEQVAVTEQVAERTTAGGGGGDFLPSTRGGRGGRPAKIKKMTRHTYRELAVPVEERAAVGGGGGDLADGRP